MSIVGEKSLATLQILHNKTNDTSINHPQLPAMPRTLNYSVPSNLIPVQANQITNEWAKETFKFAHIFVDDINTRAYNEDTDTHLDLWKAKARQIQEELKARGIEVTITYICNDMKNKNIAFTNTSPTISDDIFQILCDTDYYENNKVMARERIYYYCWGIFRVGRNEWIHDQVRKWLDEKALILDYTKNQSGRFTRKNFVYSNFCKKVGTMLSDRIIATMSRNFGEYLCCRLKGPRENINYCEIKGMCGQCYLVMLDNKNITGAKEVVLKRKLTQLVEETHKVFKPNYVCDQLEEIYRNKGIHAVEQIDIERKGEITIQLLYWCM